MGQNLILKVALSERRGSEGVRDLLRQYGLRSGWSKGELLAVGRLPSALRSMAEADIEHHLTCRIEDAVPGTNVVSMRATLLPITMTGHECSESAREGPVGATQ